MNEPKLKFPEFKGEWEEKKLGELLTYEQPTPYLVTDTNYKKSGIPVLTAGKTFILGYTDETHGVYDNLPVIIFDDFVTESKFVDFPFKVKSSAMKMLKLLDENNNLHLIYELMQLLQYPVKEHKRYWISEYSRLTIPLPPSPAEQQKIASCLSAMDDLIAAQAEKVEVLKEKKMGLMQQLFPQNGETTPRLRFPEFTGEWEVKKLGEVASSFSGGTPKSSESKYYGGDIPFIRSGEIHGCKTELYITEEGLNKSSAKLVSKGDLLIALYGATSGEVAISKIDGAINQAILCVRSQSINSNYLCNYLEYKKDTITSKFLQGGQGNLSSDIIMSLNIPSPSPTEQEKIASCLSALDDQIAAETEKITALKDYKKGLMQQLFPQPAK